MSSESLTQVVKKAEGLCYPLPSTSIPCQFRNLLLCSWLATAALIAPRSPRSRAFSSVILSFSRASAALSSPHQASTSFVTKLWSTTHLSAQSSVQLTVDRLHCFRADFSSLCLLFSGPHNHHAALHLARLWQPSVVGW